jgi:hypothetical protein
MFPEEQKLWLASCTFCSSIDGLLGEYGGFPDVGCTWICFLDLSCVFHPSSHCCLDLLDVPVRSSHRLTAALVLIAMIVSWSVGLINLA